MKKKIHRVVTRLVVLSILLTALSTPVGHTNDFNYFNGLFACDSNYYSALGNCRAESNYPNNPDEGDCRWQAGSAYGSCVSGLASPSYELDFCDNARAARDNCVNTYLLDGDYDAYYTCRNASGIDQCE